VRSNKLYFFVTKLWEKSVDFSHLSFLETFMFIFFCCFEFFYKVGFFCVVSIKKFLGGYHCSPFKVISVGNLSVGGTGKSVFVQFLASHVSSCAIFSRGYGHDGDEAKMLSQALSVPVFAGKDRVASFGRLRGRSVDYIILDDAYQNYQLKKDFEILLLDARSPFGNGHCLPAGPLREKDFSRADTIVLTHADEVDFSCLEKIRKELKHFPKENVFMGRHEPCRIWRGATGDSVDVKNKKMLAIAGIGSFSGFLSSLEKFGVCVGSYREYPDHVSYTKSDVEEILAAVKKGACDGVITTHKDWVKLRPLVGERHSLFYILEITFTFLSVEEEQRFFTGSRL